jgi:hypothetical protein
MGRHPHRTRAPADRHARLGLDLVLRGLRDTDRAVAAFLG